MSNLTQIAQNLTELLPIEDEKTKARVYCEVVTYLTNEVCNVMQNINSTATSRIEEELNLAAAVVVGVKIHLVSFRAVRFRGGGLI